MSDSDENEASAAQVTLKPRATPIRFDQVLNDAWIIEKIKTVCGYENCTPIQAQAIPLILQGKDIHGGARTGSGKTMAFVAPIAELLRKNHFRKALILSPTRELALQIDEEAMKILDGQTEVVPIPLYGGVEIRGQIRALQHHSPRLYIATPGRIIDLVEHEAVDLNEVDIVVLDEADRLCDMGFAPQIQRILGMMGQIKQTLLFSATLPHALNQIMERFCPNPVRVMVDDPEESSSTILHEMIFVPKRDKNLMLRRYLEAEGDGLYGIVFTRTRRGADDLYESIHRMGLRVGIIHAGYAMGERERCIRQFRDRKIDLLIATDVMARGIDVSHVTHVIHYDLPGNPEDYIHRSGRSGRAGREGRTIAFVDPRDSRETSLIEALRKKIQIHEIHYQEDSPKQASDRNPHQGQNRDGNQNRDRKRENQRDLSRDQRRQGHAQKTAKSSAGPLKQRSSSKPAETIKPRDAASSGGLFQKLKNWFGKGK